MASLKVAVRVRPFNQRERDMNAKLIIEMDGKKTRVHNPKAPGKRDANRDAFKEFTFDYSYWSHESEDTHFVSQDQVFNDLGTEVVDSAFEGYNACVFAYGQTGSGKTFTMMGSGESQGLIPRICKTLFSRMHAYIAAGNNYRTEVSYLEIYNERVKDLLRDNKNTNLRIREHNERGVYVENLSTHLVTDYTNIQDCMMLGNRHRSTAATKMNDESSRSHAIFTIKFIQAGFCNGIPSETVSKVHLVDLAGSERADSTGASGERLKEGAHINKSLVTLGSVISALAELSNQQNLSLNSSQLKSPRSTIHIPYRDSVLTYLLKDSLGGNSKTIMIAAISPADCNHSETLSTLRYANRAKNIINKPTINEDPNVKLIKELRQEISKLKALILNNVELTNPVDVKPDMLAQLQKKQAQEKDLTERWEEKWSQTQVILREERALGLRKSGLGVVLDSEIPHLIGLADDVLQTGVTLYHLKEGETLIGTEDAPTAQDIVLNVNGVEREHCSVVLANGVATLIPRDTAKCSVNSVQIEQPTRLSQGCIIVLGGTIMFRYNDPIEAAQLRKEGSRSQLNLSRQSLLSWSTNDLAMSSENLNGDELEKLELQRATLERDKETFAREQAERESDWAAEQQKRRDALEAAQKQLEIERQKMEEEYETQRRKLAEDWQRLEERQKENALALKKKQIELKRKHDLLEWERNEKLAQVDKQQSAVDQLQAELVTKQNAFKNALVAMFYNFKIDLKDNFVEKMLSNIPDTPLSEESDFVVNLLKNADQESIEAVKDLVNLHKKELASLEQKLLKKIQTLSTHRDSVTRIETELAEICIEGGGVAEPSPMDAHTLDLVRRTSLHKQQLLERKKSLKLNLKHAAAQHLQSSNTSSDPNLTSSGSPEESLSKSSSDYSSPLKTCDTFHTATSACSTKSLSSVNEHTTLNCLENITDNQNANNPNFLQNNNIISPDDVAHGSDSDDLSSTDDCKVMSTDGGNSAQSSSSFEKVSPLENIRQKRRLHVGSSRKSLGGEEAAIRAMKRLSQRMARQKMMILRNIETESSREELNKQIAVLQELQRQYVKLELALQNHVPSSELDSHACSDDTRFVLSPTRQHPLTGMPAVPRINTTSPVVEPFPDNKLFLGKQQSSTHNFRVSNNLCNNPAFYQQGCSKSSLMDQHHHCNSAEQLSECMYPAVRPYQFNSSVSVCVEPNNRHYPTISSDKEILSELSEEEPLSSTVRYNGSFSGNGDSNNSSYVNNQGPIQEASPYTISLTRSLPTFGAFESNGYIVSVPTYVLRGAGSKTHFEYEVRINVQGNRWNILRRYRRFRELHLAMRSKYGPKIEVIPFPPRQLFSSTSESVARERRGMLESYLRRLILICTTLPNCPLYTPITYNIEQPIEESQSLSDIISRLQLLEFSAFFRRGVFENGKYGTS